MTQLEAGKPFIFTAEVALKPEVTLGKYKGVKVDKIDVKVSDEDIDAEINRERESNARTISVEDRAVKDGDMTVIDFEGFVDGVAFEGGKGENHPLEIGSHSFIDTFEDQLVGKNTGDEVEVNVTFPKEYHAEDLAGKPAVFKVKINEIKTKELPELNDEFASDVSEFETLEEYKESVKKNVNVTLKPSNPDELKEVLGKMTPDQLAALKEQISKMQAKDVDAEETAEEEEEAEEVEEAKEEYEDDPQE